MENEKEMKKVEETKEVRKGKVNAEVEVNEAEEKDSLGQKIKKGFKKHKKVIIGGAIVVGGSLVVYAGYRYGIKRIDALNSKIDELNEHIKSLGEGAQNNNVSNAIEGMTNGDNSPLEIAMIGVQNVTNKIAMYGGYATKIVKRLSDGKIFETVTEAAEDAGVPLQMMSKHLNGIKDHINGDQYTIIAQGLKQKVEDLVEMEEGA